MGIATVQYTTAAHDAIVVTTDSGDIYTAPWPVKTWHAELINNWIAIGNTIADAYEETQEGQDAAAAAAAVAAEDAAAAATVKADSALVALLTATPAQIDTWLENNVTDLASARAALGMLAKAVRVIGGQVLR